MLYHFNPCHSSSSFPSVSVPPTHTNMVWRWEWAGAGRKVGGLMDRLPSPPGSICVADETPSFYPLYRSSSWKTSSIIFANPHRWHLNKAPLWLALLDWELVHSYLPPHSHVFKVLSPQAMQLSCRGCFNYLLDFILVQIYVYMCKMWGRRRRRKHIWIDTPRKVKCWCSDICYGK